MAKKKSAAKKLGRGLAYFQAMADDVLDIAFKKMKEAGDKGVKKQETDSVTGKLLFGLKKTAGFFGDIGAEFYLKYGQIKSEKKKNQDK